MVRVRLISIRHRFETNPEPNLRLRFVGNRCKRPPERHIKGLSIWRFTLCKGFSVGGGCDGSVLSLVPHRRSSGIFGLRLLQGELGCQTGCRQ